MQKFDLCKIGATNPADLKPNTMIGRDSQTRLLRWTTPTVKKPQGEFVVLLKNGLLANASPEVYGYRFYNVDA